MSGDQFQSEPISSYSQYLPTILQTDEFLGRFLLAFEHMLSGVPDAVKPPVAADTDRALAVGDRSIEATIDRLQDCFNPEAAPAEFLPWLAGWVALSLRDDWSEATQRQFIRRILSLYKIRGTRTALETMLKIYLNNEQETVRIYEFDTPAYYFQVELELSTPDLTNYRRKERVTRAIIELEKPAHTFYSLRILMPTMRLVSEELAREEGSDRLILRNELNPEDRNPTVLGTRSHTQLQSGE